MKRYIYLERRERRERWARQWRASRSAFSEIAYYVILGIVIFVGVGFGMTYSYLLVNEVIKIICK